MSDDSDDAVLALFHRIDDGPPLGFDVRDVMADGRRVRTRRVGLTVAGTVAAVAAAVVISLSVGAEAQAPDMERPARPPTSSDTRRPDTSPPATTPAPETVPGPGRTVPIPGGGAPPAADTPAHEDAPSTSPAGTTPSSNR